MLFFAFCLLLYFDFFSILPGPDPYSRCRTDLNVVAAALTSMTMTFPYTLLRSVSWNSDLDKWEDHCLIDSTSPCLYFQYWWCVKSPVCLLDSADHSIGAGLPVVGKRVRWMKIPQPVIFFCKHFGTGVLVATAFVHVGPWLNSLVQCDTKPPISSSQQPLPRLAIPVFHLSSRNNIQLCQV